MAVSVGMSRYRINRTRSLLQCGDGEREIGGEKMHK